ncbi:hypothetical protein [Saccharicrinis sp. FJH54]|uniref:hypothetical protein n=1 Tax=Saccharicrinis sp. FJH54 TaxID=3344665 RepID=UPI0035D430AB
MESLIPVIFIAAVLIFITLRFLFSKKAIVKRKLKKTKSRPILSFNSGETAKISGKIEIVGEALQAPLSGRKCAAYMVLVEQKVSNGKSTHWRTIIKEEKACRYVIRDGYKCAWVNHNNCKSYIVQDKNYRSGLWNDATPELENFLNLHGYKSENILGLNKTVRYKEGVLENGERVAVAGKGEWKFSNLVGIPDEYDRLLVFDSANGHPVYLSDDPDTFAKNN